ncbi:MAG: leucine-rich repeat domain-containing protein [Clostridia bacterium]|nr:leucine-rich repeat domain-containing protein [Clostridia bacterium]
MKKQTKKLLIGIAVVMLMMTVLCFSASAAKEFTSGYYTCLVNDGKVTITAVDNTISGDVIIPSKLGGYNVTAIGSFAFLECEDITSIVIPNSVTELGTGVFTMCYGLKSVTIPDSITNLPYGTFYYCESLQSIVIPNSVKALGDAVFDGCTSLSSVTLPAGITQISHRSFADCYSLKEIVIPDGVECIAFGAFMHCNSLEKITIPASVIEIDTSSSFSGCDNLKDVYFTGTQEEWTSIVADSSDFLLNANIHFEYADIEIPEAPSTEPEQPDTPEDPSADCSHLCHKSGFMGFIWKIINFFSKLFKTNPVCACGAAHY